MGINNNSMGGRVFQLCGLNTDSMGQKCNSLVVWKQQLSKCIGGGSVKESNSVCGGVEKKCRPHPLPQCFSFLNSPYIAMTYIICVLDLLINFLHRLRLVIHDPFRGSTVS